MFRMQALFALLLLPPLTSSLAASDWPQFLGPERNGTSAETKLIDAFPAAGPKEVWRATGGVGMSGIAVSRGRLFTLVQKDGRQWLLSLDAKTGQSPQQTDLAPAYENEMGDGPRAAPAIAGDRVFTFTGEGVLTAVDIKSGEAKWSHNVVKELGGKVADYGMASSPLVAGERVIVTAGAAKGTVAAYDIASGKLAWSAGKGPAGYSSPALLDLAGLKQVVVFAGSEALGIDPATGDVLWTYPYETNFECNIITPIIVDGRLLLSAGENHGSVLLSLEPKGKAYDIAEVWTSQGVKSVLRSEWQTPVLHEGYLYGMDNVGGAGPITHLTCIHAATGERAWQQLRFGKGNFILADGKLFISTMKGELVIVEANPKKFVELARATVLESTRQAPALADGLLYLRDDSEIVCIDVRK